ncbi:MAG: nucleotidyltransferase domain-containing protein [Bacteroidota bacterium]|nr:nucleotidyltransferase domain-containing protein [Bacteroidota bacterium]
MITNKQIQKITDIIVDEIQPEKVFLFGSYAAGLANINSDVDIIVIVNEELNKKTRLEILTRLNLKTALPNLLFSKDFKMYNLNEYAALKTNKYSFLYTALQNAKTLYERQ